MLHKKLNEQNRVAICVADDEMARCNWLVGDVLELVLLNRSRQHHLLHGFPRSDTPLFSLPSTRLAVSSKPYTSAFYLYYAPKTARLQTGTLLVLLNVVGMGLIVVLTHFLAKDSTRAHIVGWICLVFSVSVFVAPLFVVRQVIRTKSVEYMPFLLSFFLTLSAVMWFFYGLLRKDYNIAIPNILGFIFGVLQMALYLVYKNAKKAIHEKLPEIIEMEEEKQNNTIPAELKEQIIDVMKLSAIVCSEIIPVVPHLIDDHALNIDAAEKIKPGDETLKLICT
ncbi:UNVERIFIED_CONTAM: Bidirectional sugar transporter SWEET10 [Sesamum angustifolium]|uniref:Bidirectional sugar transporter SWEET n=1 Tax=Sesamum angustifolium TaxID=2727405 RepID=A0AAW2LKG7_9LAMI